MPCLDASSRQGRRLCSLCYQPFNRLLFWSEKKADVFASVECDRLDELVIATMRIAQNRKHHTRWQVAPKLEKLRLWPGSQLLANIDEGSANPGFLRKPEKSRLRFPPVANGRAQLKLKTEKSPPVVNRDRCVHAVADRATGRRPHWLR